MDLLDLIYQRKSYKNVILVGESKEVLESIESNSIDTCVTSPPYFNQRDYGMDKQIGQEDSLQEYIKNLVAVFKEVKRVLKPEGTLWINLGDTYMNKQLLGVPWKVAFALQDDGWILRSDIIWEKTHCIPSSVKDRPSGIHEYLFLFSQSPNYYYNQDAIKEPVKETSISRMKYGIGDCSKAIRVNGAPGQGLQTMQKPREKDLNREVSLFCNKKSIWKVAPASYRDVEHFATFPTELVRPCIKAGCPKGGVVLDPFFGSGTSAEVAISEGCDFLGVELNPRYAEIAQRRLKNQYSIINLGGTLSYDNENIFC